jgi:hypothetical protein
VFSFLDPHQYRESQVQSCDHSVLIQGSFICPLVSKAGPTILASHRTPDDLEELLHRIQPLLAGRAAGDNNALSAVCNRWRILNKMAEVVTLDLALNGSEQGGF